MSHLQRYGQSWLESTLRSSDSYRNQPQFERVLRSYPLPLCRYDMMNSYQ